MTLTYSNLRQCKTIAALTNIVIFATKKIFSHSNVTMAKKKTGHGGFWCLWPAQSQWKYKKSVTVWKIFESSSNLDQAESFSSNRLEMATVWSEHHHNLSIEGILYL